MVVKPVASRGSTSRSGIKIRPKFREPATVSVFGRAVHVGLWVRPMQPEKQRQAGVAGACLRLPRR